MALKTIRVTKEQMNSRVARFSELKGFDGGLPDSNHPDSIRTLFNSMYVEVDGGVQPADFSISVSGIEFPAYGCPNASSTEPINRSVRKVFIMQL